MSTVKSLFQPLERTFHQLERTFHRLECTFHRLEHKLHHRENTFIALSHNNLSIIFPICCNTGNKNGFYDTEYHTKKQKLWKAEAYQLSTISDEFSFVSEEVQFKRSNNIGNRFCGRKSFALLRQFVRNESILSGCCAKSTSISHKASASPMAYP